MVRMLTSARVTICSPIFVSFLIRILLFCCLHFKVFNRTLNLFRCKCGNCSIESLQNVSECYCCSELEGCSESMESDLVLQDIPLDVKLTCITEHPGFNPVCLQKWSLRLASWKYKTKSKQRYKQTGTEER